MLLAAGFGFNSYASLCADHVFTQGSITCQRPAKHGESVGRRCLELDYDRLNLQQCWTWFYLAELLGTDLAKDEYRAINEDGSDYDDDVGGSAYVGGRGGVELEAIDAEADAKARRAASTLHQAIEANRNI